MSDSKLYTEGSRRLQDRFDTRRIADRLEKVDLLQEFTDVHRDIIETAPMFFLATSDAEGRPDVSYKGGLPGFVRIVGPSTLAFPDYNGNGMFKSLGTLIDNPNIGHCQTKNLAIFQSTSGCWKSQVFCAVHRKPGITNTT